MKKPTVFTFLLTFVLLTSCGVDNPSATVVDNDTHVDYEKVFYTTNELAEYIKEYKGSNEKVKKFLEHSSQKDAENGFYIFQPTDISKEYTHFKIRSNGNYLYYYYWTDELQTAKENRTVTQELEQNDMLIYQWSYQEDGEVSIKYDIDDFELKQIDNSNGYYDSVSGDIYWCQDGYAFSYNPSNKGRANDDLNYNYTADDIPKMQKTFYEFE